MAKKPGKENNLEDEMDKVEEGSQSKNSTPRRLSIAKYLPKDRAVKELAIKMDVAIRENMHLETTSRNDNDQSEERNQNDSHPATPSTSRAITDAITSHQSQKKRNQWKLIQINQPYRGTIRKQMEQTTTR